MSIAATMIGATLGNPDLERLEKMSIIPYLTKATMVKDTDGKNVKMSLPTPVGLIHAQFNPNSFKVVKKISNAESAGKDQTKANLTGRIVDTVEFSLYYNSSDAGAESIGALTDFLPIEYNADKRAMGHLAYLLTNKPLRAAALQLNATAPDVMYGLTSKLFSVSDWAKFWDTMGNWNPTGHMANFLIIKWGDFTFKGQLRTLTTDYTRFAPNGSATEMTVSIQIEGERRSPNNIDVPFCSPDTDKIKDVELDSTLPGMSNYAYDTPKSWRAIANCNDIDNPRHLRLGDTLRLPALPGGRA